MKTKRLFFPLSTADKIINKILFRKEGYYLSLLHSGIASIPKTSAQVWSNRGSARSYKGMRDEMVMFSQDPNLSKSLKDVSFTTTKQKPDLQKRKNRLFRHL